VVTIFSLRDGRVFAKSRGGCTRFEKHARPSNCALNRYEIRTTQQGSEILGHLLAAQEIGNLFDLL
jgi:hypothetical protein